MPNIQSAKKRVKTIETRRQRNKKVKSSLATNMKKFEVMVNAKSADAKNFYNSLISQLDNALAKGVFHKNNIAHKKSKLTKMLNSIDA